VTILSTSSLQSVSQWYGLDLEETRKRFRATVEIEGVPAFWEDHLFSKEDRWIEFKIGEVTMLGISPRARCVVPARDSQNGNVTPAFTSTFVRHCAANLPEWSTLNDYRHHYYLTVNCFIPATEIGKIIGVGDEVTIIGEKRFY